MSYIIELVPEPDGAILVPIKYQGAQGEPGKDGVLTEELEALATEVRNNRDAAILNMVTYPTEPAGRAASAVGVYFLVQGAGKVAATQYKKIDSASSEKIADYSSLKAITDLEDAMVPKAEVLVQYSIGNSPLSGTGILASTTSCYVDFSRFEQYCKLNRVDILCSSVGTFFLIQFRPVPATTRYNAVSTNELTVTVASASVYNRIDVSNRNIQIQPGDTFGVFRNTSGFYFNSNVTGKSTQIATLSGGIFTFNNSGFPGSPLTSGTIGREMCMKFLAIENRIDTQATRIDTTNTTVAAQAAEIAVIKSKTLPIPAGFNWSADLSALANAVCIISNQHTQIGHINLPNSITLRHNSGGGFVQTPVNKIPVFNLQSLTAPWTISGGAVITGTNTFTTSTEGRLFRAGALTPDKIVTVRIKGRIDPPVGLTTRPTIQVMNSGDTFTFINFQTGEFDVTHTVKYTGTTTSINMRVNLAARVTIEIFEVFESWAINSPCAYGDLNEKNYPVIDNTKGNYALRGDTLSGMFKAPGDVVNMPDFFPSGVYPDWFFDGFVRTKWNYNQITNWRQTGHSYLSINSGVSDPNWKNFKGLSEGCSIEGADGVTIYDFYVFAVGDFMIKNINLDGARVNICNMYPRPTGSYRALRFRMENIGGKNVRVDNTFAHTAATCVITQPEFFSMKTPITIDTRNCIFLLSVVNPIFKDVELPYTTYAGGGGQPIQIMSSLNGVYENIKSSDGDSGFMFNFFIDGNASYPAWIESHAMDFMGWEGNHIKGGVIKNMGEEGLTFDPTYARADYDTLTTNRNMGYLTRIVDSEHAEIKLNRPESTNSVTMVNNMMCNISEGKNLKYSKILAVSRKTGDVDFTQFVITGPAGFFEDAEVGNYYAIVYAFYNNLIEGVTFENCKVPVLGFMFGFKNTYRQLNIKGYKASKGGFRLFSYAARTPRCYVGMSVDNVLEDSIIDENSVQIEDAKNYNEKINDWVNEPQMAPIAGITKNGEFGTVIQRNIVRNGNMKLQGLRAVTYKDNTLINVTEEITDTTYRVNSNEYINEPNNDKLDDIFAPLEAMDRMGIRICSKGDGSGVTRIVVRVKAATTVMITGNAFLYDDLAGTTGKSRLKALDVINTDIPLYVRCLDGSANIVIPNGSQITHFGGTLDAVTRYSTTNSPEILVQKSKFLAKGILQVKQTSGAARMRGNFKNLPENLQTLHVEDTNSLLEGEIAALPRTLTFVHLKYPIVYNYTPVIRGDLANLPDNCTSFYDDTRGGTYIYTTKVWPVGMKKVYFRLSVRQWWTSAMVDKLLIDLAAATWDEAGGIIDIGSGIASPVPDSLKKTQFPLKSRTSLSDEAVLILGTKLVTINIIN